MSRRTLSGESGVTTATLRTRQRLWFSPRLPVLVPSSGTDSLSASLSRLCKNFITLPISLSCFFLTYVFLTLPYVLLQFLQFVYIKSTEKHHIVVRYSVSQAKPSSRYHVRASNILAHHKLRCILQHPYYRSICRVYF